MRNALFHHKDIWSPGDCEITDASLTNVTIYRENTHERVLHLRVNSLMHLQETTYKLKADLR